MTNVKVVGETITGEKAELRVEATDTGNKAIQKATVEIVREGGIWKFVKESWATSKARSRARRAETGFTVPAATTGTTGRTWPSGTPGTPVCAPCRPWPRSPSAPD